MVLKKDMMTRLCRVAQKLGYYSEKFGWGVAIFSPQGTNLTPVCHDVQGAWRAAATNESLLTAVLDWVDDNA